MTPERKDRRGDEPCPACGGELRPWLSGIPGGDPDDPIRYALARCTSCGSAVTLGAPPAPDAYATGIYHPGRPRAGPLVALIQRTLDAQPAAILRRAGVPRSGRVLDVGAGKGRLVASLRRAGFDASGIEPSLRSLSVAQSAGREVIAGRIEELAASDLDAVVLWHVLEHLDDPLVGLRRVRASLGRDGVALVAVPNLGSWQAAIAGRSWLHLDLPRHRVHFSVAGLDALLANAGLRRERAVQMVCEHNPAAMWMALSNRLGLGSPNLLFHLIKRTVPPSPLRIIELLASLPLAPAALAFETLAAAARRGGTVAVVARRAT
ncbi:MAG: hypothetical protein DLM63_02925 [Solirubrobacterales bacterium]|nr:MAG: hypothetical protein DLM63_02925 [Solirubrobacterales bacterium]